VCPRNRLYLRDTHRTMNASIEIRNCNARRAKGAKCTQIYCKNTDLILSGSMVMPLWERPQPVDPPWYPGEKCKRIEGWTSTPKD
jgi:hypothetical protein